ncbi:ferredoxin [Chania multitudinisentens RB-25]|uniref:Ferredoxin-type protein NapF n=1 Tax=Chania multitudinisentens RB-25 TaxID=1441930 RepID=A0A0D4ZYH2_9GAMM|nr:ferredoxin-type protein NapF [Chania multitudinisentens]AJW28916.1 ferredoxin [Chania multitudinisentens RB-25]
MAELSRRGLLSGQWRHHSDAIRPPWSCENSLFLAGCTRCLACVTACETGVLITGSGGFPEVDFQRAECTFCRQCATACEASLFYPPQTHPWQLVAEFTARCLAWHGIECRSCQDNCEMQAIRFRPQLGGIAKPVLEAAACNGCGACVADCPASAIAITRSKNNE